MAGNMASRLVLLPDEILLLVFGCLKYHDVARARFACRRLAQVGKEYLYKEIYVCYGRRGVRALKGLLQFGEPKDLRRLQLISPIEWSPETDGMVALWNFQDPSVDARVFTVPSGQPHADSYQALAETLKRATSLASLIVGYPIPFNTGSEKIHIIDAYDRFWAALLAEVELPNLRHLSLDVPYISSLQPSPGGGEDHVVEDTSPETSSPAYVPRDLLGRLESLTVALGCSNDQRDGSAHGAYVNLIPAAKNLSSILIRSRSAGTTLGVLPEDLWNIEYVNTNPPRPILPSRLITSSRLTTLELHAQWAPAGFFYSLIEANRHTLRSVRMHDVALQRGAWTDVLGAFAGCRGLIHWRVRALWYGEDNLLSDAIMQQSREGGDHLISDAIMQQQGGNEGSGAGAGAGGEGSVLSRFYFVGPQELLTPDRHEWHAYGDFMRLINTRRRRRGLAPYTPRADMELATREDYRYECLRFVPLAAVRDGRARPGQCHAA